jgi:hypothetical protein
MDKESHRELLLTFFGKVGCPVDKKQLVDALYSFSERGLWPDHVDDVSIEQPIMCWALIEKLKTTPFPKELRM